MLIEFIRPVFNEPLSIKNGNEHILWSRFSDVTGIPKDVLRVRNPQQRFGDLAPELLVIAVQNRFEVSGPNVQVFPEMKITGSNITGPTHTRFTPIHELSLKPTVLFSVVIRFNRDNTQSAIVTLPDANGSFINNTGNFEAVDLNESNASKVLTVLQDCIIAARHYFLEINNSKPI